MPRAIRSNVHMHIAMRLLREYDTSDQFAVILKANAVRHGDMIFPDLGCHPLRNGFRLVSDNSLHASTRKCHVFARLMSDAMAGENPYVRAASAVVIQLFIFQ